MKIGLNFFSSKQRKLAVKREESRDRLIYVNPFDEIFYSFSLCQMVKIDDSFKYYHYNLTGDAKTDLIDIYGRLDYHNSSDILGKNFDANLAKIQQSLDINVTYYDGLYAISNGCHRIVYLKEHYDRTKEVYEVPMFVTRSLSDTRMCNILKTLLVRYDRNIGILKNDFKHIDDNSLFLRYEGIIYYISGYEDLYDFNKRLSNNEDLSKYRYEYLRENNVNVRDIFKRLFVLLGDELFNMSFKDIYEYIKVNNVANIEDINFRELFKGYYQLMANYYLCIAYDFDITDSFLDNLMFLNRRTKGTKIIDELFKSHPEYLEYDFDTLYNLFRTIPELNKYSRDRLREIALNCGFKDKRLVKKGVIV